MDSKWARLTCGRLKALPWNAAWKHRASNGPAGRLTAHSSTSGRAARTYVVWPDVHSSIPLNVLSRANAGVGSGQNVGYHYQTIIINDWKIRPTMASGN